MQQDIFTNYQSETELMRYIFRLAEKDFSLVDGMMPLGSCTMKLNSAAELNPVSWAKLSSIDKFISNLEAGYETVVGERGLKLSGGEKQRVAIARAIINKPAILLADEPTGALDSKTTEDVLDLFDKLHESGITIVLVTHEDEVANRARKIAKFKDGKIVELKVN